MAVHSAVVCGRCRDCITVVVVASLAVAVAITGISTPSLRTGVASGSCLCWMRKGTDANTTTTAATANQKRSSKDSTVVSTARSHALAVAARIIYLRRFVPLRAAIAESTEPSPCTVTATTRGLGGRERWCVVIAFASLLGVTGAQVPLQRASESRVWSCQAVLITGAERKQRLQHCIVHRTRSFSVIGVRAVRRRVDAGVVISRDIKA